MSELIGRWAHAPDLIEPIIGYRAWSFEMSDRGVQLGRLSGPPLLDPPNGGWAGSWRGWVTSSCSLPGRSHIAPDEDCTCGFYATKSRDDSPSLLFVMMAQAGLIPDREEGAGVVFGSVHLAGKVIEHDAGYRGERARIAELIPTTTDGGVTVALAARLEVPVGPSLDTGTLHERVHEDLAVGPSVQSRHLGPVDRWRLKTHRRHFRVITGEGGAAP